MRRALFRESVSALLLTLLLVGFWWWFHRTDDSPPSYAQCRRPVEVRIQGDDRGFLVACTADEFAEALERLGLPQAPGDPAALPGTLYDTTGSGCRLTLTRAGDVASVEEGVLTGAVALALGWPLDLNRAGATDLEALPGVGPSLARAIVADREANGPFCSIEALDRVAGVGPAFLEKHAPQLKADCP